MTNIQRQKWCDEQKWAVSEAKGFDQSGAMDWCMGCKYQNENGCEIPHDLRVEGKACANAYNRYERKRRATK